MTNWQDYYNFNDPSREIDFWRSDMPTPWINYLSNGNFHVMISQAGGGLAWFRSPQIWRITRYRFYNLPMDRPGPYLYLRDAESGEYWSVSGEPCTHKPEQWSSSHGMGYSRFSCEEKGIAASATYFVPPDEDVLIKRMTVSNNSGRSRRIDLVAYVEFSLMEYLREVQWQCYMKHQISVTYQQDYDGLLYHYGMIQQMKPMETPEIYFAADQPLTSWDGNRDVFIGSYRSEADPIGLEKGCQKSDLVGGDGCGALQCSLELKPGETREVSFFLGAVQTPVGVSIAAHKAIEIGTEAAKSKLESLRAPGAVEAHWQALKSYWDARLNVFQAQLPDTDAQRQVNVWNPYQAERNFLFSRSISYYALGFRGVGFRDTAQDILATISLDLSTSRAKIHELMGQQYQDGHCNHMCFPVEGMEPLNKEHSDDHLWPILTVWSWIAESGDTAILDDAAPYYDGGEGTVYDHLCRSFAFTRGRMGENGLPLMLASDWNDSMWKVCQKGKGESFWTAMQLGVVLPKLAEMARIKHDEETAKLAEDFTAELTAAVNKIGWDGAWFKRAIMDDGTVLGTHTAPQAQIFLNSQSWSVMSNMGTPEQQRQAMDSVAELLDTPLGIKKVHPAVTDYPSADDPLFSYHPGMGENAAIFCHANTWAVIAECMLNRPEKAWKYYHQMIPHIASQTAGMEKYMGEPYAYASNLFGPDADRFGLANVTWLTGTAAWMYIAATQYILGIKPEIAGLRITPCIPKSWPGFKVERVFRGCKYDITVEQTGRDKAEIEVDGVVIEGNLITHCDERVSCKVVVKL